MTTLKLIFACMSLMFSLAARADAPPAPIAVLGDGVAYVGESDDLEQLAKQNAVENAKALCGSGSVLFAENIGYTIHHLNATTCKPHTFCDPTPGSVTAQGVFVCLANIPK